MEFLGNQRFLFVEQRVSDLDIAKALARIDPLIIDSAKLDFDSSDIILEFRDNPRVHGFAQKSVLIGRLITGFEQSIFEKLSYRDYTESNFTEHTIAAGEDWNELFTSLLLIVPKESQAWKLRIDDSVSQIIVQF